MKYAEKFQQYLDGKLSEEESKKITEDIEKYEVLTEFADKKIDDFLFQDEGETEETVKFHKAISKEVNRKIFTYSFVVVLIAIIVIDIGRTYLPLWVSRVYYTPFKYQDVLYSEEFYEAGDVREFKKSIETYRELFYGAKGHLNIHETRIKSEGYGVYDMRFTVEAAEEKYQYPLKLKRNKLENLYWGMEEIDWFDTGITEEDFSYPTTENMFQEDKKDVLSNVGDGGLVRVAISFHSLKNMEQIKDFMSKYEGDYLYIPLDIKEKDKKSGEEILVAGIGYDPQKKENVSENDIISKLTYLIEQNEFNEVFQTNVDMANACNYLKKNGVNGYGAVVCMDKKQLENVMTADDVVGIRVLENL